jgi:hypothetical protein
MRPAWRLGVQEIYGKLANDTARNDAIINDVDGASIAFLTEEARAGQQ